MSHVLVKNGSYRNQAVENTVFPIKNFQTKKGGGGFVTVDGRCRFGAGATKIRVALNTPKDIQFVEQDSYNVQEGAKAEVRYKAELKFTAEQDAQRMDEIATRFEILDQMTKSLIKK